MKKMNLDSISDTLEETVDFPNHLLTGSILITIQGNKEALIENYQGIIEYNDNQIKLKSRKEEVIISGDKLEIHYYTQEELKMSGNIKMLEIYPGI